MLENYTREITDKERSILQCDINESEKRIRKSRGVLLVLTILVILIGIPLAIAKFNQDRVLGYLAIGVIGIYLGIMVSTIVKENRIFRNRIWAYNEAIAHNKVKLLHCKASAMVELEESEDEGLHYLFQVDENKILSLQGQQYYEAENFPNSDFEIAEIKPVYFQIYCNGEKINPVKIIRAKQKDEWLNKGYNLPENLQVLEGKVEDIEKIVQPNITSKKVI